MKHFDRVWAEVDLDAVAYNVESIKNSIKEDTKIIAVIKTDGYGHGAIPIARTLEHDEKIWGYAVATAEESIALREKDIKKPILILGYTFPYSYEKLILNDVRLTVFMLDVAQMISEKAVELKKTCKIHIKIDTGMTRIGIHPDDEGIKLIKQITKQHANNVKAYNVIFCTLEIFKFPKVFKLSKIFFNFSAEFIDSNNFRCSSIHIGCNKNKVSIGFFIPRNTSVNWNINVFGITFPKHTHVRYRSYILILSARMRNPIILILCYKYGFFKSHHVMTKRNICIYSLV